MIIILSQVDCQQATVILLHKAEDCNVPYTRTPESAHRDCVSGYS